MKRYESKFNEFGPLMHPSRGSVSSKINIVSYPMNKIKVGDRFIAKRDGERLINKGDKIVITSILPGPYRSLKFYGTINNKQAANNKPFELVDLQTAIGS